MDLIESVESEIRRYQMSLYRTPCRARVRETFDVWFPAFVTHLEGEVSRSGRPEDVAVPCAKTVSCPSGFHLRDHGGKKIVRAFGMKNEKHKLFVQALVSAGAVVVVREPAKGVDGSPLRLDARPLLAAIRASRENPSPDNLFSF